MAEMTATRTGAADGWRPESMSERVVVRCYPTLHEAQSAVDQLTVAARIPDSRITVLGRGLRWRETINAQRTVGGVAAGGAVLAAGVAALLWAFGALDASFSLVSALLAGAALGGVLGGLLGLVVWLRTRDDPSVPQTGIVDVDRYDVLVEVGEAERARELLER
jgi:hypothetical protein